MSPKVSHCLSSFVLLAFLAISPSANAQQSECLPVNNDPLVMANLCSGPPMTGPLPAVLKMNVSKPPRNLQPIAAEAINHMRLVDFPMIGRGDALMYEANRSDFILELDVSNGKQIVVEPMTQADAENTTIAWKQGRTKLDYAETVSQSIVGIRIKPLHEIGTPLLVRGVKIVRYGRTILELAVSYPGRGEQPFEPSTSYPQDPRVMPTSVTMPSLLSKEAQPGFAASHIPGFSMSPMMFQTSGTSTDANHYKFQGKELDDETGLYNFGARYYSPGLGRYMSSDWSARPTPIPYANIFDPQTLNLYSFGRNNPLSMRDPDGHCPDGICTNIATLTPAQVNHKGEAIKNAAIGGLQALGSAAYHADMVPNKREPKMLQPKNEAQAVGKAVTSGAIAVGSVVAGSTASAGTAVSESTAVMHFTNDATVDAITASGTPLNAGSFVTLPSEIPAGASSSEIESLLEIGPGKGQNNITFETPTSNLEVPANGVKTSGGATQYQLEKPAKVDPSKFKKTDGNN